jgi:hypothetical protein
MSHCIPYIRADSTQQQKTALILTVTLCVSTWTGLSYPTTAKITLPNNAKIVINSSVTERTSQLIFGEASNGNHL